MAFDLQPITIQSLFRQQRSFGPITVQVILQELTTDTLTITKQPVQTGASITDHAYKEPTVVSMQMRFSDNILVSLSETYAQLLDLQNSRQPFDVLTPKRIYEDMLIASLGLTTDKLTENVLAINITFQQVIFVSVATVQVPKSRLQNPKKNQAIQPKGKQSFVYSGFNLITTGR
jgi:hypothetical protein